MTRPTAHIPPIEDLGHPVTVFTLDGLVRSKSNYRHGRKSGTWNAIAGYETLVNLTARSHRAPDWPAPDPATPPGKRPMIVAALFATTTLDIANVSKSVLDACEGVLYVTDAQVRPVLQSGYRTTRDPHLIAAFAALPATTALATAHEVAAHLGAVTLDVHARRAAPTQ